MQWTDRRFTKSTTIASSIRQWVWRWLTCWNGVRTDRISTAGLFWYARIQNKVAVKNPLRTAHTVPIYVKYTTAVRKYLQITMNISWEFSPQFSHGPCYYWQSKNPSITAHIVQIDARFTVGENITIRLTMSLLTLTHYLHYCYQCGTSTQKHQYISLHLSTPLHLASLTHYLYHCFLRWYLYKNYAAESTNTVSHDNTL